MAPVARRRSNAVVTLRWFCTSVLLWVAFAAIGVAAARSVPAADAPALVEASARAATLPRLHALIVTHAGSIVLERAFRGRGLDVPVDIKSLSKIVIDSLIGIAIDQNLITGTEQPVLPLLQRRAPAGLDPRVAAITIGDLLWMRAGLERTSGRTHYGAWVNSPDWVRYALTRPFVDQPGGAMIYSTGDTHLLSAILTDVSGESTWQLARRWLAAPLSIEIPAWTRDPQGIYFGGNEMTLSPRALVKLGETYRSGGTYRGRRILSADWVRRSWTPQATDRLGRHYGYGWFISEADGVRVYFGWGFGGQMIYVVPSIELTIVMISDSSRRSVDDDYICALHELLSEQLMPAFMSQPAPANAASSLCTLSKEAAAQL
jgi:CubicO group peptidase (beta-lactamase class C family)